MYLNFIEVFRELWQRRFRSRLNFSDEDLIWRFISAKSNLHLSFWTFLTLRPKNASKIKANLEFHKSSDNFFSFYRSKSTIFLKKFVFKTCYNIFRTNIKGVFRTKISGLYSKKAAWQTWKAWILGLQEAAKAEKEGRNNWCEQRVGSGRVIQVGNMNLHESFTRTGECTRIWRVPMHDQKS